jgi:hypothetical protein
MDTKIRYELEFPLNSSPQLLYQYISTPLNALNTNIISNINTSILNSSYTITYSLSYNDNIITSTRNIYVTNLPLIDIFFWIDASNNSTITSNNGTISTIQDMSINQITMISYGNVQLIANGINNLSVININNNGLISSTNYLNSLNFTFAIVTNIFQASNLSLFFAQSTYDLSLFDGFQFYMSNQNFSFYNSGGNFTIIMNTPIILIVTFSLQNLQINVSMVNLLNGISTNLINPNKSFINISLSNFYFFIGQFNSTSNNNAYIGEIMYILLSLQKISKHNILSFELESVHGFGIIIFI